MKKICFLYAAVAVSALLLTSCQFFQVGYWQQLAERTGGQTKVQSMPDYSKRYTWDEISLERAEQLWGAQAYKKSLRNPPQSVTVYQKDRDGKIVKYSDCEIEKFPNYIYPKEIAEYIYVYAFESMIMDNNYARLNYYIPSNLPEGTKIYEARESSEFVKVEIPLGGQDNDENEEFTNPINNVIFKNGLMIQFDKGYLTFIEY